MGYLYTLRHFLSRYFFNHPVLYYAFILPVYLPVRSLGEDFPVYHLLMQSDYERIFYFLYVLFQSAIAGLLLSLVLRLLLKKKCVTDASLLPMMRVISLLMVLLFVFSTYSILKPNSVYMLYLASGVHYTCSAFLANLIILETKHHKLPVGLHDNDISKSIASGVFGLNVDILGIMAYGVMYCFVGHIGVRHYITFCVGLEIAFFVYLLFVKQYWRDIIRLLNSHAPFVQVVSYYAMAILVSILIALVGSETHYILCASFLAIVVMYGLLRKDVSRGTLFAIFTGNVAYGSVIVILMSPIFILSMPDESHALMAYTKLIPLESVISGAVMGAILWLVCKRMIRTGANDTCRYIYKHAAVVIIMPVILYGMGLAYEPIFVLAFFLLYSYIESTTRYGVRELILTVESDAVATRLNYFNFLIWRGVIPSFFFLAIKALQPLGNEHLTLLWSSLMFSVMALLLCMFGLAFGSKN